MPILLPLLKKYGLYVVVAVVVLSLAWQLWKPKPPVPEVYAVAAHQADGSVVLEKKPDPSAKPVHEIPKGAKVERVVKVTVQPKMQASKPATQANSGSREDMAKVEPIPCPPVTVDLSLVRMPDETRRVIASSPDGEIIGGVDIPVEAAQPTASEKLWATGAVYNPFKQTYGGFVDRDLGPFRLGAQVNQASGQGGIETWGKVGLRF